MKGYFSFGEIFVEDRKVDDNESIINKVVQCILCIYDTGYK